VEAARKRSTSAPAQRSGAHGDGTNGSNPLPSSGESTANRPTPRQGPAAPRIVLHVLDHARPQRADGPVGRMGDHRGLLSQAEGCWTFDARDRMPRQSRLTVHHPAQNAQTVTRPLNGRETQRGRYDLERWPKPEDFRAKVFEDRETPGNWRVVFRPRPRSRKSSSHPTRRWRKADSNCWSHLERDQPFRACHAGFRAAVPDAINTREESLSPRHAEIISARALAAD
jgi:hypothetical protein